MRTLMRAIVARRARPERPERPRPKEYGPGPSRIVYRLSRLWMKTWVRRVAMALPLAVLALMVVRLAVDPQVRAMLAAQRDAAIAALSQRPAFAVSAVRVSGASGRLTRQIRQVVSLAPNASSLTVDVDAIQARLAMLGGVRRASVTLRPDGVLRISVDERAAAALWRDEEGRLWITGRHGVPIARAGARADHPTLPVVMGEGAQAAMEEALVLFHAVPALHPRLRAFVRIGERRWDMVLDHDLRIMLPADEPEAALARVMALQYGREVLERDLAAIDMRLSARPTLRLTPEAADVLHPDATASNSNSDMEQET